MSAKSKRTPKDKLKNHLNQHVKKCQCGCKLIPFMGCPKHGWKKVKLT